MTDNVIDFVQAAADRRTQRLIAHGKEEALVPITEAEPQTIFLGEGEVQEIDATLFEIINVELAANIFMLNLVNIIQDSDLDESLKVEMTSGVLISFIVYYKNLSDSEASEQGLFDIPFESLLNIFSTTFCDVAEPEDELLFGLDVKRKVVILTINDKGIFVKTEEDGYFSFFPLGGHDDMSIKVIE